MNISREHVAITISSLSLIVSVIVMLWGNDLFGRLTEKVEDVERKTNSIEQQFVQIVAESSLAPITENTLPNAMLKSRKQRIDFHAFNITLSDIPEQEQMVNGWLNNPHSGYPALAEAIRSVMGSHRLAGNSVPLTIINAKNLEAHGRPTNQPFTSSTEINPSKLERAIYVAWREKNSGSSLRSFQDVTR